MGTSGDEILAELPGMYAMDDSQEMAPVTPTFNVLLGAGSCATFFDILQH